MSPLISIIIPTYNRAHLISETLDSILVQTFSNWECIVVDDGSTDHTDKILGGFCKKDNRFQYYQRPEDRSKGANACRNYGFELSKGEYVNWFDDDDLMIENKLELQIKKFKSLNDSFTVCQTLVFENDINNILGLRKDKIYSNDFFNDFIQNNIKWLTQAPLIRKSFLIEKNIIFDESLSRSQERDYFVNLLDKVDNYQYDDTPLVLLRLHNDSISHSKLQIEKCYSSFKVNIRILEKYKNKLSYKSILYLKKQLKSDLKTGLKFKNNDLILKMVKQLYDKEINLSLFDKVKVLAGIASIKIFNRGDVFFN